MMFAYFNNPGVVFVTGVFWCFLVMVTASLVYQSWGCTRIRNGRFAPSNFETNPAPAVIYVVINIIPVVFASVYGVNGMTIDIGIDRNAVSSIVGWVFVVLFLVFLGYTQIRRNGVREFIYDNKRKSQRSSILKAVGTIDAF
ncbi:MAG: hypothetical protein WAW00_03400 [Candidatus Moraniibacteriota bacterium]